MSFATVMSVQAFCNDVSIVFTLFNLFSHPVTNIPFLAYHMFYIANFYSSQVHNYFILYMFVNILFSML